MNNFLTFNQLDYQCLKEAKMGDDDIHPDVRKNYINSKLMKIYGMLDGVNDPFYNRGITFSTPTTDQEFLADTDVNSGIITSINSTTKVIVRSTGVFVAGSLIIVTYTPVDSFGGDITSQWIGRITTGGASAVYAVVSGTDATLTGTIGASVTVIKSMSASTIDVSAVYFKNFTCIYDNKYTTTADERLRVFDEIRDAKKFFNRSLDISSAKRIAWYQQGDLILLDVGLSAIALGTVKGDYRGKPALFTDATGANVIDIPPEVNQALIDEVTASYFLDAGQSVPDEIKARILDYEKKFHDVSKVDKENIEEKKSK